MKDIGRYAFIGCESLRGIGLPNATERLGKGAFFGCKKLTDARIGRNMKSIGEFAFRECDLGSITFDGTKARWQEIGKGYGWDEYTHSYTVHCTDGDIKRSI